MRISEKAPFAVTQGFGQALVDIETLHAITMKPGVASAHKRAGLVAAICKFIAVVKARGTFINVGCTIGAPRALLAGTCVRAVGIGTPNPRPAGV